MQNKNLWLTSLSSTNDSKELFYSHDKFLKIFLKIDNFPAKEYFQTILVDNKEEFNVLASGDISNLFSFSFSSKKDYLPNWKMYGDDLKGVCICFDREKLENYVKGGVKSRIFQK